MNSKFKAIVKKENNRREKNTHGILAKRTEVREIIRIANVYFKILMKDTFLNVLCISEFSRFKKFTGCLKNAE